MFYGGYRTSIAGVDATALKGACERTEGIAVLSDPSNIGLGGVLLSKAEGRREVTCAQFGDR